MVQTHDLSAAQKEGTDVRHSAELTEGDSFSWNACVPHEVRNTGVETAVVLIAVQKDGGQREDGL